MSKLNFTIVPKTVLHNCTKNILEHTNTIKKVRFTTGNLTHLIGKIWSALYKKSC